jgi:hypothetical protein
MGNKNCVIYNELSEKEKTILFENMKVAYTKEDVTFISFKYIENSGNNPKVFIQPFTNKTQYIFTNELEFINFMKKFNRRFIINQQSTQHGIINFVI